MKQIMACILIVLSFCLLSGCGVAYMQNSEQALATASPEDFGVMPENYKEQIQELMAKLLKDPESARYTDWGAPYKGTVQASLASPTPVLCWRVYVNINAKNSFGGYTGGKRYGFAFVSGKIFAFGQTDRLGNWL